MGKRSQRGMTPKKDNTLYIIAGVLVLAIGVIVFAVASPTANVIAGEGEFDEFAQCLTDEGAIFFGTEWCGFCQQQKDMFGPSLQYVDFVDCDENRNTCMQEGIRGYPTWKIDGELYSGVQQMNRLSDLTGCPLEA